MGLESFFEKPKFNGDVEVKVIDNGLMVAHYSPSHERHVVRYLPDAASFTEYLEGVVALFRQQTEQTLGKVPGN
jgi:hypothetical protein